MNKWRSAFHLFKQRGTCTHPVRYPGILTCSNGAFQYKYACRVCGSSVSNPMKHEEAIRIGVEKFETIDPESPDRWYRKSNRERWFSLYTHYLQSSEWLDLRERVMEHWDGQCARCENTANHVHHLTYERVGEEWLSDLLALCTDCHEQAHKQDD